MHKSKVKTENQCTVSFSIQASYRVAGFWYERSCGVLYASLTDTDALYNNVQMTNVSIP